MSKKILKNTGPKTNEDDLLEAIKKYLELKTELLKVTKCLECCSELDKEFYYNIAEEYCKKIKLTGAHLNKEIDISTCHCLFENEDV